MMQNEVEMKPGDTIEWAHLHANVVVHKGERLWSSTMEQFVNIGEPALLISITGQIYTWLNSDGLFHASLYDTTVISATVWVGPRKCV